MKQEITLFLSGGIFVAYLVLIYDIFVKAKLGKGEAGLFIFGVSFGLLVATLMRELCE